MTTMSDTPLSGRSRKSSPWTPSLIGDDFYNDVNETDREQENYRGNITTEETEFEEECGGCHYTDL